MRKSIFLVLVFLSVIILVVRFGVAPLTKMLGFEQKAGIKITSVPQAKVSINDKEVGETPYTDETLKPGEYLVKVTQDKAIWQGKVNISAGTLAVLNRELGETPASSSGEVLTLVKGKGVVITSNPPDSKVEIDGKEYGKTPLSLPELTPGEHTFLLSHDNYLKRSIRAYVPDKLALSLYVDLALTEVDLSSIPTTPQTEVKEVVVKQTPTGFLRVRERASINSAEITRVDSGETLTLLDETTGWYKIRTPDGKEGFVSSTYAEKKTTQ